MKKSKNLLILLVVALIGAAILHKEIILIPPALAFILGGLFCTLLLYFLTSTPVDSAVQSNNPTQTIYVGNLPYSANENAVKDLFSQYGEVFAVRLMKDKRTGKRRGFGFVVMSVEHAPSAIRKLNNKEYQDRTLKVREANEPKMSDSE